MKAIIHSPSCLSVIHNLLFPSFKPLSVYPPRYYSCYNSNLVTFFCWHCRGKSACNDENSKRRITLASLVTYVAANAVANSPRPSVNSELFPPSEPISDSSC